MQTSEVRSRSRARRIRLLLSLLITITVFTFLFSSINLDQVVETLLNADLTGILLFMLLSFFMSVLRSWRYQLVLGISGYRPSLLPLFLVVLVGNFVSDLLPARIGSLVYIFIVTSRLSVPLGAATSSFALAFLFDVLSLAPVVLFAAWIAQSQAVLVLPGGALLVFALLVLAVVTLIIVKLPSCCLLLQRFSAQSRFLSAKHRLKISELAGQLAEEFREARKSGVYGRLFLLSILIRTVKYSAMTMYLYALVRPMGYTFAELGIGRSFLGIAAADVAASLPVAGIAGFGAYEGAWALSFQFLGLPSTIAKVTSIPHHLFIQVYGYLLGGIALGILLLPWFKSEPKIVQRERKSEGSTEFARKIALPILLLGFSSLLLLSPFNG